MCNIQSCIPQVDDNEIKALILCTPQIPAIVRRQETSPAQQVLDDGLLCVGFLSPRIIEGVRLRIGSKVPLDCIIDQKTPFDVVKYEKTNFPFSESLEALINEGIRRNIQVGCFGSAALQLVTALPYLREKSDLDIYLRHHGSYGDLEQFFERLLFYEKQFGIIIDAEIEYTRQYSVKLKELLGPGKTVLGKGLYDVALLEKRSFPEP